MILTSLNTTIAKKSLAHLKEISCEVDHLVLGDSVVSSTPTPEALKKDEIFVDFFTSGLVCKKEIAADLLLFSVPRNLKKMVREALFDAIRVTVWVEGERLLRLSTMNPKGHCFGGSVFTLAIWDES